MDITIYNLKKKKILVDPAFWAIWKLTIFVEFLLNELQRIKW